MSDILLVESANIFVGKHDPSKSKHLKVSALVLPTIEYTTVEHAGGGAAMKVKWNMGQINALEPTFKLVGFDEEAYRAAGIGSNAVEVFTMRGSIRRKSDGRELEMVAKFRGSMGSIKPGEYGASKEFDHDHGLTDVTYYRLLIGGKEWFCVDFWRSKRVRFGVDELAQRRQFLGLA
jgi:hypothetical protein